jgi:hypothetical protein
MQTEYIIQYKSCSGDWIDCHTQRYASAEPAILMLHLVRHTDTEYRIIKRTYTDEVLTEKE